MSSGSVNFKGKSGDQYSFQTWPMDTKFKPVAGVYLVTQRTYEDRTFPTKASHRCLAIGQTTNLAEPFASKAEMSKLVAKGANCLCVCAVSDERRRAEIEKDLIDGNAQWGGALHYLFHAPVPEKAPGAPPPEGA